MDYLILIENSILVLLRLSVEADEAGRVADALDMQDVAEDLGRALAELRS